MIRFVEGMLRAHDLSQLAERSNSQVQQISAASRNIFSILSTRLLIQLLIRSTR